MEILKRTRNLYMYTCIGFWYVYTFPLKYNYNFRSEFKTKLLPNKFIVFNFSLTFLETFPLNPLLTHDSDTCNLLEKILSYIIH